MDIEVSQEDQRGAILRGTSSVEVSSSSRKLLMGPGGR